MPSVYQLKPAFQGLLRQLVSACARAGITANQVTIAAMLLSAATGAALLAWPMPRMLLLLPGVLLLRMALNAMDGMLAREHGQASPLGMMLNELGDVVSDAALYLPLALDPAFDARAVVVLVVLAALGELAGVLAQAMGHARRYDGPFGKSDRALLFGALGLALGLGVPGGAWLDALLWLAVLLTALTVVNRVRRALREGAR